MLFDLRSDVRESTHLQGEGRILGFTFSGGEVDKEVLGTISTKLEGV
jgi:hypothetical protein